MSAPRPRILQCGFPNSGNYLTFRVLEALQRASGTWRSFREESGFGPFLRSEFAPEAFAFPEEPDVDYVRRGSQETTFRRVPANLALVHAVSSLMWTHDLPSEADSYAPADERPRVYILRDGRDAITSLLFRRTSARERQNYAEYTLDDPTLLAQQPGYFERLVQQWCAHTSEVLARSDGFLVRYEALVTEKQQTVEALAAWLGVDLCADLLAAILHATDPEVARQHAASHVRRAAPAGHRKLFTPAMHATYERLAGDLHRAAGYSLEPPRSLSA